MPGFRLLTVSLAAAWWPLGALAQPGASLVSIEARGNLHAAGVVATIAGDDDRDATATLAWRRAGDALWRSGHPLVRIDDVHFAGSLVGLAPATAYEARVTLADPDGTAGATSATAAFSTRAEALPEPGGRTLHVAPGGDDAHSGLDPARPLATLQRAADLARPGDLVLAAAGIYRESVTVTTSGTAAEPIVFRGAGGAVLDGADAAIAAGVAWRADPEGVFSRVLGFATGHVVTDRGRLYRYPSLAELRALGAGAPGGFYFDGSRLHVKLAGSSSPAGATVHVARFEDGFYLEGVSHVRVEGFEIRHFGAGDYGKGVYLRYSSDCVVRGNRIHEVEAAGVWIKGGERHRVEDNEIWDTSIFDWPWPLAKGSSAENNAIVLTDDVGRGHVLRRNAVTGTFNGIGPCGGAPPSGAVTVEVDVYDNVLARHTDDAFEPEGYCANVRLWGNHVEDVHMAFAVAPAAPGPTWIFRNTAYGVGATRTSQADGYTASVLKVNSGYATPVGPVFLYHNTFVTTAPATDAVALLNPGESTYLRGRNNVFAGTRYVLDKVNPIVLDWDGDLLFTTDPGRFVKWEGMRYATLAELRAATGQELAGVAAAPELTAPAAGDFRPRAGSPLVDRGLPIPGFSEPWAGAAPEIGAVELTALFADGFESGDLSAWSSAVCGAPEPADIVGQPSRLHPEQAGRLHHPDS